MSSSMIDNDIQKLQNERDTAFNTQSRLQDEMERRWKSCENLDPSAEISVWEMVDGKEVFIRITKEEYLNNIQSQIAEQEDIILNCNKSLKDIEVTLSNQKDGKHYSDNIKLDQLEFEVRRLEDQKNDMEKYKKSKNPYEINTFNNYQEKLQKAINNRDAFEKGIQQNQSTQSASSNANSFETNIHTKSSDVRGKLEQFYKKEYQDKPGYMPPKTTGDTLCMLFKSDEECVAFNIKFAAANPNLKVEIQSPDGKILARLEGGVLKRGTTNIAIKEGESFDPPAMKLGAMSDNPIDALKSFAELRKTQVNDDTPTVKPEPDPELPSPP